MLDNRYALLFIRGERPICDTKYDVTKHPNVAGTTDGDAPPYQHGVDSRSIASVCLEEKRIQPEKTGTNELNLDFQLLSEEELEEYFDKERSDHEKQQ